MKQLTLDSNMIEAIDLWIEMALPPGSCTELALRGQYKDAFQHAHPHIKPHFDDFIYYIEHHVPMYCRNENYDKWNGIHRYNNRHEFDEELSKELFKL